MPLICSSRETFIEREPGESANDRNDRAIRVAVKWYNQHLKTLESGPDGLKVVLLTNDQGNKQKAQEDNLVAYRCNSFIVQSDFLTVFSWIKLAFTWYQLNSLSQLFIF